MKYIAFPVFIAYFLLREFTQPQSVSLSLSENGFWIMQLLTLMCVWDSKNLLTRMVVMTPFLYLLFMWNDFYDLYNLPVILGMISLMQTAVLHQFKEDPFAVWISPSTPMEEIDLKRNYIRKLLAAMIGAGAGLLVFDLVKMIALDFHIGAYIFLYLAVIVWFAYWIGDILLSWPRRHFQHVFAIMMGLSVGASFIQQQTHTSTPVIFALLSVAHFVGLVMYHKKALAWQAHT